MQCWDSTRLSLIDERAWRLGLTACSIVADIAKAVAPYSPPTDPAAASAIVQLLESKALDGKASGQNLDQLLVATAPAPAAALPADESSHLKSRGCACGFEPLPPALRASRCWRLWQRASQGQSRSMPRAVDKADAVIAARLQEEVAAGAGPAAGSHLSGSRAAAGAASANHSASSGALAGLRIPPDTERFHVS